MLIGRRVMSGTCLSERPRMRRRRVKAGRTQDSVFSHWSHLPLFAAADWSTSFEWHLPEGKAQDEEKKGEGR